MSVYFKGPVLVTGVQNLNDRFYANETALDIVKQFMNMKYPCYGELILSDSWQELTISKGAINLSNVSHKIISLNTKMTYDHSAEGGGSRTEIEATIELLDNDKGRLAKEMIGNLSMSIRGVGSMEPFAYLDPKTKFLEGECLGVKVANYEFHSIDLINKEEWSFRSYFK